MRIAIDILAYAPGKTGATVYWRKMFDLLPAIDPSIDYYVFVTPAQEQYYRAKGGQSWPTVHFVPLTYSAKSTSARLYCQEVDIPRFCNQNEIDIHLTCNPVPAFCTIKGIEIWMVLNLQFYFFLLQTGFLRTIYWRIVGRVKAGRASVIIANSHYSATVLRDIGRMPASKITTIYEALDHDMFQPGPPDTDFMQSLSRDSAINLPYILNVSDNWPYKRQVDLIRAFAQLCQKRAIPYHSLVIVGNDCAGYRNRLIHEAKMLGIGDRVTFLDFLPIEALPNLYRAADLFVYPSELESFGIPPLEAMACGIPVVVSNRSAVLEISGGGSWVVDPSDHEGLARAMETLLTNQSCRHGLVRRGLRWVQRYHWLKHAEQLIQLFYSLVS